jgi:hypothetical protein
MTDIFNVLAYVVDRRLRRGNLNQCDEELLSHLLYLYNSDHLAPIRGEQLKLLGAPVRDAIRLAIIATSLVGHVAPLTGLKKHPLGRQLTKRARDARERPEIREAIVSVRGAGRVGHPWTTAGEILGKINAYLKQRGLSPTDQHAVYRRLKVFPRT